MKDGERGDEGKHKYLGAWKHRTCSLAQLLPTEPVSPPPPSVLCSVSPPACPLSPRTPTTPDSHFDGQGQVQLDLLLSVTGSVSVNLRRRPARAQTRRARPGPAVRCHCLSQIPPRPRSPRKRARRGGDTLGHTGLSRSAPTLRPPTPLILHQLLPLFLK